MAIQQNRIIRYLMVVGIVVLTIFIYASYYSNPISNPTRMHSTAALISLNTNNIIDDNSIGKINGNNGDNNNNINNNRINNGILFPDQQNNANFNLVRDVNTSYAPQYSDIDSTNFGLQKFIKYADRILKNLTTSTTASTINNLTNDQRNTKDSQLPKSPSQTAIRISIPPVGSDNNIGSSTLLNVTQTNDPSKGIITSTIYESGHMDVHPNLCPNEGDDLKLLIIITSAPTHTEARLAIRQTWGHYVNRRDVRIGFILGRTLNQLTEDTLNAENYLYGDLIRGHFIDSYNNLTLKTISTLEWVDKKCSHASYILKTDDDMFINVPKLLQFIDKHQNHDKRIIYGRLAKKWKPIRNKKSKYYVSPGQFSQNIFPQFTTGPAYLMSSDCIHDLYIKSLEHTYLKLEDVFTTGIVAQLLNIKRIHVYEFLNRRIAFNPCNIRKAISVHMIKSNEQFDLWKKLLDTTTKCK